MGEIDTNSIKSVQAAISLFGEKIDQKKRPSTSSDELDRDEELEALLKGLANLKVQLEAKDSAYKQATLKLDHYHKTSDELSVLLKSSEFEKDIYINECREDRRKVHELEFKIAEMSYQLSENAKTREQISHFENELKFAKAEFERMETDLDISKNAKIEALTRVEVLETELEMEKGRIEELMFHVSELNEVIMFSKLAANEREREICAMLLEKEAELESRTRKCNELEEKLEDIRKEIELVSDLENQLMAKSLAIDKMRLEIQQVNELQSSSERAASVAVNELNRLKSDFEVRERKSSDQMAYIKLLETELSQLRLELKNAKEEVKCVNSDSENRKSEIERVKNEMEEIRERETEAQVEIAILKSEIHKGRARIAEAEAAEERIKSEKSSLYIAVQQLASEAEEAKKDNRMLRKMETEREDESNGYIKISKEEYEGLLEDAEGGNQVNQLEFLKTDLEKANVKIGELRAKAEQAASRAEVAEKNKATLENQIRRWRERREKRKTALAALREESLPEESTSFSYGQAASPTPYQQVPKTYQPLGKVLNMKF